MPTAISFNLQVVEAVEREVVQGKDKFYQVVTSVGVELVESLSISLSLDTSLHILAFIKLIGLFAT